MGQRLVRAKSKIGQAGIPFRLPERADLRRASRCRARRDLRRVRRGLVRSRRHRDERGVTSPRKAIWLGRLVASLLPDEPEALGLVGADAPCRGAARRAARAPTASTCRSPSRTRQRGMRALIEEAEALLFRASARGRDRPLSARSRGAIGACRAPPHRPRRLGGDLAALRCALRDDRIAGGGDQPRRGAGRDARRRGRPRGAAGAGRGSRLAEYQPYWAARAELLARTGEAAADAGPMSARSGWRPTRRCGGSCSDGGRSVRALPEPRQDGAGALRVHAWQGGKCRTRPSSASDTAIWQLSRLLKRRSLAVQVQHFVFRRAHRRNQRQLRRLDIDVAGAAGQRAAAFGDNFVNAVGDRRQHDARSRGALPVRSAFPRTKQK